MTTVATLRYCSILVTGVRGFVGPHLVAALRHKMPGGGRLHLLDRSDDPSCDLLDAAGLRRTVAQAAPSGSVVIGRAISRRCRGDLGY